MEKLNKEIEETYYELIADEDENEATRKSFDFSSIRDNFRQHVHNRRSADASNLVLLDPELVQNLLSLKNKSFDLLLKFSHSTIDPSKEHARVKSFSSFEEFVNFVMNEEEILSSEIWKLEAIFNYLDQLELDSPAAPTQGV